MTAHLSWGYFLAIDRDFIAAYECSASTFGFVYGVLSVRWSFYYVPYSLELTPFAPFIICDFSRSFYLCVLGLHIRIRSSPRKWKTGFVETARSLIRDACDLWRHLGCHCWCLTRFRFNEMKRKKPVHETCELEPAFNVIGNARIDIKASTFQGGRLDVFSWMRAIRCIHENNSGGTHVTVLSCDCGC